MDERVLDWVRVAERDWEGATVPEALLVTLPELLLEADAEMEPVPLADAEVEGVLLPVTVRVALTECVGVFVAVAVTVGVTWMPRTVMGPTYSAYAEPVLSSADVSSTRRKYAGDATDGSGESNCVANCGDVTVLMLMNGPVAFGEYCTNSVLEGVAKFMDSVTATLVRM